MIIYMVCVNCEYQGQNLKQVKFRIDTFERITHTFIDKNKN
ncbi:hypothetical protein M2135_002649 [Parabacteroides sp. PF5-9]|nr:hypothetical protein [Parabacteroides sp. PF5-9]